MTEVTLAIPCREANGQNKRRLGVLSQNPCLAEQRLPLGSTCIVTQSYICHLLQCKHISDSLRVPKMCWHHIEEKKPDLLLSRFSRRERSGLKFSPSPSLCLPSSPDGIPHPLYKSESGPARMFSCVSVCPCPCVCVPNKGFYALLIQHLRKHHMEKE